MRDYTLAHVSDSVLLRDLTALVAHDRQTTAKLLAHLAEVDARRLYVPAGYSSMHAYCVEELHLSEDAAFRRIQAARAARQFPLLLVALAEGRLHLTAVTLLAPCLTPENAAELIEAATHRRKSEVEAFLAGRFSPREIPTRVRAVPSVVNLRQRELEIELSIGMERHELALARVDEVRTEAPPSPERYLLQLTIGKSTEEKLRHAQALLSHALPSGDLAQLLDRALDALVRELEKKKLGVPLPSTLWETIRDPAALHLTSSEARRLGTGPTSTAARHAVFWSSIMSSRWREAERRRWRGFGCDAARTINTKPSASWEPSSWAESVRRRGGRHPKLGA